MRWVLLSALTDSPSTELFLSAARARGIDARLVDPLAAVVTLGRGAGGVLGLGELNADLVFTRMGSSAPRSGFDALHALEQLGLTCVNSSRALLLARDKLSSYQALHAAGAPLPSSVAIGPRCDPSLVPAALGPPPWVAKDPVGTQGSSVWKVDDLTALDALQQTCPRLLVQEYIAESKGTDIRVLVLGGRAVAAMQRTARPGEWRSNLHQGGSARATELTPELAAPAEAAATSLGLEVAGVDLLPSQRGPRIAEVNGAPGLDGLSRACGPRVVEQLLDHLTTVVVPGRGEP